MEEPLVPPGIQALIIDPVHCVSRLRDSTWLLLDIRSAADFAQACISESVNVPIPIAVATDEDRADHTVQNFKRLFEDHPYWQALEPYRSTITLVIYGTDQAPRWTRTIYPILHYLNQRRHEQNITCVSRWGDVKYLQQGFSQMYSMFPSSCVIRKTENLENGPESFTNSISQVRRPSHVPLTPRVEKISQELYIQLTGRNVYIGDSQRIGEFVSRTDIRCHLMDLRSTEVSVMWQYALSARHKYPCSAHLGRSPIEIFGTSDPLQAYNACIRALHEIAVHERQNDYVYITCDAPYGQDASMALAALYLMYNTKSCSLIDALSTLYSHTSNIRIHPTYMRVLHQHEIMRELHTKVPATVQHPSLAPRTWYIMHNNPRPPSEVFKTHLSFIASTTPKPPGSPQHKTPESRLCAIQ